MKDIKVANITEEGRYGGPQSRIAKVAAILKKKGVETTVICPSIDSQIFVKELQESGVLYAAIPMHRMTLQLRHLIGYILFFIPEVFALKKKLQENNFDIIHCNGCWQLKGMLAAKLAKTKSIVIYHLNDTHALKIIKMIFTVLASRLVDAFILSCIRTKKYYIDNSSLEEHLNFVVYPPVDTNKFNTLVEMDAKISSLPGLKIITVCNIHHGKGIKELVEVCDILNSKFNSIEFSFCVVGPVNKSQLTYFASLEQIIELKKINNFYFAGEKLDIPAALKAADIFVCASHFESGPMTVWEAMSMSLPVVSTDVGDVKTFLKEGQCGFCVPVGDIVGMADKISILIQNQDLRDKMGCNARKFAVENFDLEICAEKHASFYKELLLKKEKI